MALEKLSDAWYDVRDWFMRRLCPSLGKLVVASPSSLWAKTLYMDSMVEFLMTFHPDGRYLDDVRDVIIKAFDFRLAKAGIDEKEGKVFSSHLK